VNSTLAQSESVHLLQIWIEPDEKGLTPRYAEKSFPTAPKGAWHLVTSKTGRDGSLPIRQDAGHLWLAKLEARGDCAAHQLAKDRHAWIHVAEGEITLNGETLRAGDAAALDKAINEKKFPPRNHHRFFFSI
jgi:redox-sensitive bicupin YhaK (pirin superfamily)